MGNSKIWPAALSSSNWSASAISPCPDVRPRPTTPVVTAPSGPFCIFFAIPIETELQALTPIHITPVGKGTEPDHLFKTLLALYHYLGYHGPVGENMKYIAYDRHHNPLACLLFGAAACRKTAPRDAFIGWDAETRARNLHLLANNMRFLIPWPLGFVFPT